MSGPIFITGASRCGTELLRSVLNRHPEVYITGETHYFADPRRRLTNPDAPSDAERQMLLDHFMRVSQHGYGMPISATDGPARERLVSAWDAAGPRADDLFAANCEIRACAEDKSRWGEKTPRHLYSIDDILRAFPTAQIIVCQRDPRAAVISYRDWRNNWFERETLDDDTLAAVLLEERRARRSYSLTFAALLWRSAIETGRAAQARHGKDRVYLHRYEDLVENPEKTVKEITDWLKLSFTTDVLHVNIVNSSYTKLENSRGIDPLVGNRWRGKITPDEASYIEFLTASQMKALGYSRDYERPSAIFLASQAARMGPEFFKILLANRARLGNIPQFIKERSRGALHR